MKQTLPRFAWWVGLCNIIVLVSVICASGATAPPVKRVLILHSLGRDFAPYSAASSEFRTELARQLAAPIEFLEASLESARFVEGGSEIPFVEYLRALFAERSVDLLVPFGAPAMNFLQRHRDSLFPGVPLLVGTVDERRLKAINLGANATAVGTHLDLPGIVENILRLLPATRDIEVVIGNSPLEKFWLTELRQDLKPFTDRVSFTWLNELSFEETRKRLADRRRDTAVLFAVLLVDAAGVPHEQERALEILHTESNAPIFGVFESQLGRGIVGGPLYPLQEVGHEGARLAVRILNGESPGNIRPLLLGSTTPVYDWRELKRWGISETRLPTGSIVRFRQPTIWQQYGWYIIIAIAIIAIQAAMIADLLLHRARRRRAEAELREGREFMDLAAKAGELGLWVRDVSGNEVWVNGPLRSLFGFGENDTVRLSDMLARTHPDDSARVVSQVERAQQNGLPFEEEFRILLPEGKERWVLAKGRAVNEPSSRGARRMGVVMDLTERKQAEEALRAMEEQFRLVADAAPVMIWMAGTDKLCTYFNKAWLGFTGRTMEQEQGNGWAEGVHREDLDRCLEVYVNSFDARQEFTMEYRLRRFDGDYCWVLDNGVPRLDSNGTFRGYIGSCIDITERKRAEERFRLAVEASPSAIMMVDQRGQIILVNVQTEKLLGYSREELVGQSVEVLVPERFRGEHPGHRTGFFVAPQARPMGAGRVLFARRKDGSECMVEIGINPIDTAEGTVVLTAIVDITERRRAESELQRQREELAHVTRVSMMGELTASLAHELNQPLTAILSNAQAAQRFLATKPVNLDEVREILLDIVDDNSRAGEIIRRIRALVKKEEPTFARLDLSAVTRDVVAVVHNDAILRNVQVQSQASVEVPPVRGDRIQLQQVLLNLFLNAFDAMKECRADERQVSVRVESDGAGMVEVSVRDRGTGLTSDKLDRIFEPFFTTKKDGLGMGLSISRSIVEAHGGHLWVENNQDCGATFHVVLPVSSDAEQKPESLV